MKTCPECTGDGVIEKGTDDEQQRAAAVVASALAHAARIARMRDNHGR